MATQKKMSQKDVLKHVEAAREELEIIEEKAHIKKHVSGFTEFVRKQGVVGLAVGLAIGTAATTFVKSIVDNMINPLVGALLPGSTDLSSKFICLGNSGGQCVNKLAYGVVIGNLISFLAISFVIYFVVMGLKLDKLDIPKDQK